VDGVGPEAFGRTIEAALRRERLALAAGLALIAAAAWLYLSRMAASMDGDMAAGFAMTLVMWTVMMAAMMLPSASPAILLYAAMARKNAGRGGALAAAWIFVAGYLLAWAGFSAAAALLQGALGHAGLLTPMMSSASPWLSGALLLAAGAYQLTPLKNACLGKCREPVSFFMTHWHPGPAGALRMGATHGAYCVGCCWMLMLLLFALGVMNLAWVALVAAFVVVEKLLPAGRFSSRLAGMALILAGLTVLVSSHLS
jgi:predicted metal-binding membrane protein